MGDTFGKGSTCQEAASQGHCTKNAIRKMCCNMCKIADKLGNTANGGGAAITDNGSAFNPWAKDGCHDASAKEMEKKFGKAASCAHAAATGGCKAGKTIKKMCCASCGGSRKLWGAPTSGGSKCPPCNCDKGAAKKEGKKGGCSDMSDAAFKTHYHKLFQTMVESIIAKKHEKSCPHAMMMNKCSDENIKDACCTSCKADDGAVCVDKDADELSRLLGKKGVSCGTLAAAGRCDHKKVKKHCCARCRFKEAFKTCEDVSEAKLKILLGRDAGEGGCAHAAANGLCEKNSLAHKACWETCELHRDITQ